MSVAPAPAVFADANVLYRASLRDILIFLALTDIIELHWSIAVLDEMARALIANNRATPAGTHALIASMTAALPDAEVPAASLPSGVQLPDPDDSHVLGAAVASGCSILLTSNVSDFPASQLALCGSIRPIDPDAYLQALLAVDEYPVLEAVKKSRLKLIKSPLTAGEHIDRLGNAGLPGFAAALRQRMDRLA